MHAFFDPHQSRNRPILNEIWKGALHNIIVALEPFVGPCPLFQFLDPYTQSGGLLGREISTDIHDSYGIRTNNPSVRASEDSSCLRPGGHCDRNSTM
jgi:hypothetical protein